MPKVTHFNSLSTTMVCQGVASSSNLERPGFSAHYFREAAAIIPVLEHLPCHITDVLYPVALVHRTRTWELIGFTELAFVNIL